MKRHPALISLSHDHHHALVEARRLRRAADSDEDPKPVAATFVEFFAAVNVPHFREEEETLFPLVAELDEARPLIVEALLDHQRLHALVAELRHSSDVRAAMRQIGELLEGHVRREERELFPMIEKLAAARLAHAGRSIAGGPVWGQASGDLNATLLAWGPGDGPAENVNDERDVFVFLVDGAAMITIDDEVRHLAPGDAVIIAKGRRRKITAGHRGARYLSVHLRRPALQIQPRALPRSRDP
jgi:mannose-6-phosphate isomerase-like protein (cupin superfamily)